ncbi:uncharacterized protein HaLaN_30727, partial [Haematococcus lacustris]
GVDLLALALPYVCRKHPNLRVVIAATTLVAFTTEVHKEVLPPDMMELAEPSAGGLCQAIDRALQRVLTAQPEEQHRR